MSTHPHLPRHDRASDLQIAGLAPMSSVDWPGRLVATVFCQGCPWACPYCHNHAILDPCLPGVVDWARVEDLLARRHGLLDGVVFSGGEATRQLALAPAMRVVREAGFEVGLHTAGPYPHRLADLLEEGLVDWVGLDVKATEAQYERAVGRRGAGRKAWEALRVLLAHPEVAHEVRLTVHPGGPGTEDALAVARLCAEAGVRAFALQQARAEGTADTFEAGVGDPDWEERFSALASRIESLGFPALAIRTA